MTISKNKLNHEFIEGAWSEFESSPSDDQAQDDFMSVFMSESALDKEIQPSTDLKRRFYSYLMTSNQILLRHGILFRIRFIMARAVQYLTNSQLRLATQFLAVIIAFTSGVVVHSNFQSSSVTEREQHTLKNLLVIALLNQSSAPDRLTAFNFIDAKSEYDSDMAKHLLEVLRKDDSDGIRLAVLKHLDNALPFIRNELVYSLRYQRSPLVQMTIVSMLKYDRPLSGEEIEEIGSMNNIDARLLKDEVFFKNNKVTSGNGVI